MGTPVDDVINLFLSRVEEDRSFFHYRGMSDEESMKIVKSRSTQYLKLAIARVTLDCHPSISFMLTDDKENFSETLTYVEEFLLSSLMYEYYLEKDIARLKTYNVNYTSSELRVFDPSNARTSFQALYDDIRGQNLCLLDSYRNTDRVTGEFTSIDFDQYAEES